MYKTINEAITAALKESNKPLSAKDIYTVIEEKGYYKFNSKNPVAIVSGEIRKRCEGPQSKGKVLYKKVDSGGYTLVPS
jgi:hypothetical protein